MRRIIATSLLILFGLPLIAPLLALSRDPDAYLPEHTTFDVTVGKSFGELVTVTVNAINVANRRVLLDNSLTVGGFHYNDPRQIYGEVHYRFHCFR